VLSGTDVSLRLGQLERVAECSTPHPPPTTLLCQSIKPQQQPSPKGSAFVSSTESLAMKGGYPLFVVGGGGGVFVVSQMADAA